MDTELIFVLTIVFGLMAYNLYKNRKMIKELINTSHGLLIKKMGVDNGRYRIRFK